MPGQKIFPGQCRFPSISFDVSVEQRNGTRTSPRQSRRSLAGNTKKGEAIMKFMMIVKHKENMGFPPKELMEAIDKLSQEASQAGTMLGSGGLKPTETGARVVLANGKISVVDGPFTEAKEIIGGYAQFELTSKAEAIQSAVEFM